ncbi:MAG: ion transporter [Armatimonadetes bacterium]|nr:ion transporter [Armatimonadota bacterium]
MSCRCRRLADSRWFQHAVLVVIVANAVLIGIETDRALTARNAALFGVLNAVVQAIFVLEIAIRLAAHAPRLWPFFRDGWNVFDFAIVAVSLMPMAGPFVSVARLARLLRALRVVSAIPELRLIVGTMLRSIPSLGNVVVLLGLIIYVYAVLGVHLFGLSDPQRWGALPVAALTLFQILTLEGWVELQSHAMRTAPNAWIYFVSFVVLASFVVVNLFIAIVINNLEAAKAEERAETRADAEAIFERLGEVRAMLAEIEAGLKRQAS